MKLDRKLIKEQAKQLIKNNIWKLLLITIVVSVLTGSSGIAVMGVNAFEEVFDAFEDRVEDRVENGVDDYFNGFGFFSDDDNYYYEENENGEDEFDPGYFNDFEFEGEGKMNLLPTARLNTLSLKINDFFDGFSLLSIIMLPLTVTLWGVYLSLVRGKCLEVDETFSLVFGKTFDKNYFKKLGVVVLSGIFTFLWSLLFIIPGIVYAYKIRFALMIMAEHPELSPMEAIKLSKRMTDGHKGELFALDLSFIPCYLVVAITLGLAGIYVIPYKNTVDALYYVNFKVRCEQEGRIMPQDYLSANERIQQDAQPYYPPQGGSEYYQPQQNSGEYYRPQSNSGDYYQPPQQNGADYYQPPVQNDSNSYYQPPQSHNYYPPQETAYTPVDDKDDSTFGSNMDNNYWNGGNI